MAPTARSNAPALIAVLVQFACAAVIAFGDIGFDHPGRFGLSFGHLLWLGAVYVIALLFGVIRAAKARSTKLILVQVALLLALGAGITAPLFRTYAPVQPAAVERGR